MRPQTTADMMPAYSEGFKSEWPAEGRAGTNDKSDKAVSCEGAMICQARLTSAFF